MISGAVIIGRPIGPDMIRPFELPEFYDFYSYCNLNLPITFPMEVAYPDCLMDSNLDYREGVLVNVSGGEETAKDFESRVTEVLIRAGKLCEELNTSTNQRIPSDLHHQKVLWYDGKTYKPYMQILKTYDRKDSKSRYFEIASDLLAKTKDARITRYNAQQAIKYTFDMERLANSLH